MLHVNKMVSVTFFAEKKKPKKQPSAKAPQLSHKFQLKKC